MWSLKKWGRDRESANAGERERRSAVTPTSEGFENGFIEAQCKSVNRIVEVLEQVRLSKVGWPFISPLISSLIAGRSRLGKSVGIGFSSRLNAS